ncbi:MAG: TadE/TadG family type IV pilus assembly protein, partial [Janthinobacterium lividum]
KHHAMAALDRIRRSLQRFARDRRGGVAILFGIAAVMLLFFAGAGVDLARSMNQKAQIQGAADAAALAGAGTYTSAATLAAATAAANNYMNQFKATSGLSALTFTVTPGTASSSGSVTVYTMTVKASAPIANSLMAMAKSSNTVGVTAVAQNPVYNITISLSAFSSSAVDTNTIAYYTVPADGSAPTVTTPLFSNAASANLPANPAPIQLTASQKLGFMLTNTTDGNAVTTTTTCTLIQTLFQGCKPGTTSNSYGNNSYGGISGTSHKFYSHMMPPSKLAYSQVTQNCSLQVLTSATAKPSSGSCFNALPAYATVNCVQASGMTLYYYWNDMGGGNPKTPNLTDGSSDDKDYNDAVYSVTCSQVSNTAPKSLVLTN